MAWIESHQQLGQHPKTQQLATLLKVSLPTAVGHLHFLWWWALDFAPTGVVPNPTPALIAHAARWTGKPDRLWLALIQAGFIDVDEDTVTVHDWLDYAGRLVSKRAANAERMRAARATHKTRTSGARVEHVQGLPYPTVPNPTGPDSLAAAAAALPGVPGRVPRSRAQSDPPPDVQAQIDAMNAEAHRTPEQIATLVANLGKTNGSSSSSDSSGV